jgi:vacuolar-type H+-ATPase subunit F/Vma7
MGAPVFLGDEAAAAGWRLAGIEARVPAPGSEEDALADAIAGAPLVLLSADLASRLPPAALQAGLRLLSPLVVVVPDLRGRVPLPDVSARMRRQLGIEA